MSETATESRITPAALRKVLDLQGSRQEMAAVKDALEKASLPSFGEPLQVLPRLEQALRLIGIRGARLARSAVDYLDTRHLPVLLDYRGQVWALTQIRDGLALLDSGGGEVIEVPRADIASATVIWLALPGSAEATDDTRPALGLLLRALTARKRILVEVALATFLTSVLTVATSLFAQQVYDRVIPSFAYATLWALAGVVGLLLVFDLFLRVARARMLDRMSRDLDEEISYEIFKSLLDVRLDARPQSVGSLAAQISGLDAARQFFTSGALFTLAEIPFALLFIFVINLIDGPLAWIYLAIALLAIAVGLWAQFRVRKMSKQAMQGGYRRNGLLVEAISGGETIKALGAGWRFSDRWRDATEHVSDSALQSRQASALATALTFNLSMIAYIAVIVFGVIEIEAGLLTVGGLIATTILGGRVIGPISNGLNLMTQAQTAMQSLVAMDAVLKLPREREFGATMINPAQMKHDIVFEGVRFFYDDAPVPNLDIPRLTLSPGDRVVLVGPPGSGKSTLLRILAGLYRPGAGRLLIGDVDQALLDPERVRSLVALMPQEIQLFNGSLRSNLQIGGAVDDAQLVDVVRLLGLDSLLADHPRGLDRPIAEGGSGLSVGQRQLCGVARLLLRRPRLWLLDEPSSSLDQQTEKRMYDTLKNCVQPEDIVVVATHRPSAVPFCDRVIVMQKGRVVADGDRDTVQAKLRAQVQRIKGEPA